MLNFPPMLLTAPFSPAITKIMQEDRRMRILQILIVSPAQLTNEDVLKKALLAVGHATSSDLLRTEIMWGTEQGLLEAWSENELYIVKLTQRGEDVGQGVANVPGVARVSCET
ncbi:MULTISPECIES: ArsR family transcriptional regulator [Pectobacterium]|uniref:VpaChn25_0724 family phage protein n=1 Tax=Pectobacterium TaxID=122277 RepID=UPI00200F54B9|nr:MULTISPECIES: ArsR family transcriptional regulator [Pectobacterium]UPY96716.1 ArsR family transcriptional regulator [Pectobacterium sp. 21LCBS03]WJM79725.1 ArsR family transcriptional regulator [Pectobacterium brasiliense]